MERNLERKTLSFSKGMTNVPSDLLSDDSELLESDGFIFKDGEMKAVQKPKYVTNGRPILYIHKGADYRTYVMFNEKSKYYEGEKDEIIFAKSKEDGTIESGPWQAFEIDVEIYDVNSVGNTVVVTTSGGLYYFVYKSKTYKFLKDFPELTYQFTFEKPSYSGSFRPDEYDRTLMNVNNCVDHTANQTMYYDTNGAFIKQGGTEPSGMFQTGQFHSFWIKSDGTNGTKYYNEFQETVQGHVMQAINWVKSKNMFAFPFFIRCAFKLYDGSYTKITAPIICYPTVNRNCRFSGATFENKYYTDLNQMTGTGDIFYFIEYSELKFKFGSISEDWKDIIKEIVVFATEQVVPFEISKGWRFLSPNDTHRKPFANYGFSSYKEDVFNYDRPSKIIPHSEIQPTYKTDQDIIEELKGKTQFYKLFSVGINTKGLGEAGNWFYSVNGTHYGQPTFIADGVVSNLSTQSQLKVDDYYSRAKLTSKKIYTYNNRLHLYGVERYPFAGFKKLVGREGLASDNNYIMYTHIVSNLVDTWTMSAIAISDSFLRGWFYYPDPNAKEIILYGSGKYLSIPLTEHPFLNGAYSFTNLPSKDGDATFETITEEELLEKTKNLNVPEVLNSQIFTSVVNNPFVFEASGDNTIGTGKIIGIVANTEAVSQGQFGQYPLLVFTDEGIYAMSVTSEGLYGSVHPISREVCNNPDSITPTDRLVYFTSDKGLMAISGGTAKCVSTSMSGKIPKNFKKLLTESFLDFLKNCIIAYDYRDSLLRIYKKSKGWFKNESGEQDFDENEKIYYIYNMVDGTFGMSVVDAPIDKIANDYPDNVVQDIAMSIFTLTGKPDINEDTESYSGSFTTRPLKLGGSMTLKSLRAVKHLFDSDEGTIGLEIYGSNDCKLWCKLPSIGGKPWKYFTFKYTLQNFKAADSFAGSIVEVQSRREDKMR